jgi:hypothetical protein
MSKLVLLLASDSDLPLGKGIAMIAFFGSVAIFASVATFSSQDRLTSWAGFIGTNNPLVARGICIVSALVGWLAVAATVAALSGLLK